jgi:Lon protease-like protein
MTGPFDPRFEDLPATLPIFPLPGALLLPRGKLPLNIFEPRYLAMVRDALRTDRLIGMVQPTELEAETAEPVKHAASVYPTGCAGRIVAFSEVVDDDGTGRYLITLHGLIRFAIGQEVDSIGGYRRVVPDFARFRGDLADAPPARIDRDRLLKALRAYFRQQGISVDWEAIGKTDDEKLVTSLAMICPFAASEKQALLESPGLAERCQLMTALIEMAVLGRGGGEAARH